MDISGVTFRGPKLIEAPILSDLPSEYSDTLRKINGFVALDGGFHLRGACDFPPWHSLVAAWRGVEPLHLLFPALLDSDIPFAQDCMGDQFVLRNSIVHRLAAESGTVESMALSWQQFFTSLLANPFEFLQLHPLIQFQREGGRLQPGQLLLAYPPFVTTEAGGGVALSAVSADERLRFLSDFSRQLARIPKGQQFRTVVAE
ncbi:MAG TPA: hypothetical protein VNX27_13670 [Chthoniobacterales bacterium]|jgi:hypothetical protein|nr:hypothetical protein [Chthoniobacterales bacterium]